VLVVGEVRLVGDPETVRRLQRGSDRLLAVSCFGLGLLVAVVGLQYWWWAVLSGVLLMAGAGVMWWVAGWKPSYPGRGNDLTEFKRANRFSLLAGALLVAGIAATIAGAKLSGLR
jgi:zinc transporter ZupT